MYFQSLYLSVALTLLQVLLSSASPLAVAQTGSLVKRAQVFTCDNDTIPYGFDGVYEGFTSLTQLCIGYPLGLGFICSGNGEKGVRAPLSILARYVAGNDPEIIEHGCNKCKCSNVAPETPERIEPSLTVSCNLDAEGEQAAPQGNDPATGSCQAADEPNFWRTAGDPQAGANPVNCAPDHGKPLIDDCEFARQIQEDHIMGIMSETANNPQYVEFMTPGAPRMHQYISNGVPTFPMDSPLTHTYGSCAVSTIISAATGAPKTDVVSIIQLLSTMWSINAECVEKDPPNVGGWEHLGKFGRAIELHIYEIGSTIDRSIKIETASTTNGRASSISSFSGSSGIDSSEESDKAASSDSESTADSPPSSKGIKVCSSPIKCTNAAIKYICNWKETHGPKAVLELLYGSVATLANNKLATCIQE